MKDFDKSKSCELFGEDTKQGVEMKDFVKIQSTMQQQNNLLTTAQNLLWAVKNNIDYQPFVQILATYTLEDLVVQLKSDEQKLTFWVNVYNAFIQIVYVEKMGQFRNPSHFFTKRQILIGGRLWSFDDIEHGILRRSQWKYGLGYITKPFVRSYEKKLRVFQVDFRIHFALNCGAVSCPPIAFYTVENLENQLNTATSNYLENETVGFLEENRIEVPALFLWFKGDFGGKKGAIQILQQYGIIPKDTNPKIQYRKYDWTLKLKNFV